jgi:glutaredoxin-like YruB-family protein
MIDKKVVVYSTPACPWCKKAKEYLTEKNISYLEYDVAENKDAAREMIQKSEQMSVPVITIGDEVVVGFNPTLLDSLLS